MSKNPYNVMGITEFMGIITAYSETKIPKGNLKECYNQMLMPDQSYQTRWGTAPFGPDMGAAPDGFFEYTKTDNTRQLIVIAGGSPYVVDPVANTKTLITGATFTAGKRVFFIQIANKMYAGNGVDPLARYDGAVFTQYSSISTPTGVTNTNTVLTAGSNSYYYRVSAINAVGETLASTELVVSVNLTRDKWSAAAANVTLNWTAVTGATQYTIYVDTASGYGQQLVQVSANSFVDNGQLFPNPYIQPPVQDTSSGPKLSQMCLAGNRIWGITPNEPWTVYYSGAGAYLGNFAPAFGGGWIRLEFGGKGRTGGILDFQNAPHILMNTPDGKGAIWNVSLTTQTINNTTFTVPIPNKIIAAVGTPAAGSVVQVENDVMFFNLYKIGVLGYETGMLSVLRVNELSRPIRNVISSVAQNSLSNPCAYYYDRKVFFSLPAVSGSNNVIYVFDREQAQWYGPWTIGVTQFGQYTDINNQTRFLASNGTRLIEFSPNYAGDSGVAFTQRITTGRIQVSEDFTQFARSKYAWVRLRNLRGNVQFTIYGTMKKQPLRAVGTRSITASGTIGTSGFGNDLMGDFILGDTNSIPKGYSDESVKKEIKVNKLVNDVEFTLQSSGLNDFWGVTGLETWLYPTRTRTPSDWRN
jgi:hypothetical protein